VDAGILGRFRGRGARKRVGGKVKLPLKGGGGRRRQGTFPGPYKEPNLKGTLSTRSFKRKGGALNWVCGGKGGGGGTPTEESGRKEKAPPGSATKSSAHRREEGCAGKLLEPRARKKKDHGTPKAIANPLKKKGQTVESRKKKKGSSPWEKTFAALEGE